MPIGVLVEHCSIDRGFYGFGRNQTQVYASEPKMGTNATFHVSIKMFENFAKIRKKSTKMYVL